jgi:hypothetical protein
VHAAYDQGRGADDDTNHAVVAVDCRCQKGVVRSAADVKGVAAALAA